MGAARLTNKLERLTYRKSLRAGWAMVWRAALLGGLFGPIVFFVWSSGLIALLIEVGLPSAAVRAVWPSLMAALLTIGSLLIALQMLLAARFTSFKIRFDRQDGAASGLGFVESLGPTWFLSWRTVVLVAAPIWIGDVLTGAYYEPALSGRSVTPVIRVLGGLALITAGLSLTLRSLVSKRFRTGQFVVSRAASAGPGLDGALLEWSAVANPAAYAGGVMDGAQKKGLSPLAWVGIGCAGLVVLAIIAITVGGIFVAKKAADFVEDAEGNPAAAAAEMLVSLNPELDLVESDREAGTITIREKSSGKVITVNFDQIQEGRISFEDESGETASFGASSGEAVELPDWLPVYPGAVTAQGGFSSVAGGKRSGMFTFKTNDAPEDVLAHYESTFNELGLEVSKSSVTSGNQKVQNLNGKSPDYAINATVTEAAGDTGVAITYQGPE